MSNKRNLKKSTREFWSNNTFSAALDNVLAMFPSTILMPILINSVVGFELFSISAVLLMSGISTLVYLAITGGKLPGYLGSSFAFIGVTTYIVAIAVGEGLTQGEVMSLVLGGHICAAAYMVILSLLTKIGDDSTQRTQEIIDKIIPKAVMGPALSLIGLELSGQAAEQAGLYNGFNEMSAFALLTIALIVFLSVTRRSFFKKSSILIGLCVAGIIAMITDHWDISPVISAPILQVPGIRFVLPKFNFAVAIAIFPPTLVLFSEHIGRKIMIENLKSGQEKIGERVEEVQKLSLFHTMSANAVANLVSVVCGGVPLTLYAENLAVMRINNDSRPNQLYIAAIVVMIISFNGNLLQLVSSIPDPILGGLSLVLMGIIAAPGIKLLVDAKVDYNKITNLFLTASVLIAGLSSMSINVFGTEFKGMSLGLLVGIVLNLVFMALSKLSILRDHLSFNELCNYCSSLGEGRCIEVHKRDGDTECDYFINGAKFATVSQDFDALRVVLLTDLPDEECIAVYGEKKIDGKVAVEVDGRFGDKRMKEMITRSYHIAKGEDIAAIDSLHLQKKKIKGKKV